MGGGGNGEVDNTAFCMIVDKSSLSVVHRLGCTDFISPVDVTVKINSQVPVAIATGFPAAFISRDSS